MKNILQSPELKDTRIEGLIGQTLERFCYERMESPEALDVVYREAENAFVTKLDDARAPVGIWQGEFWGKLMISACRYADYSQHPELIERLRRAVRHFLTLQEPDGYLGTYRNSLLVVAPDPEKARAQCGWACNWNWNIWCRKYTLWGLLEAYKLLREPAVLEAAQGLAGHLIGQLHGHGIRIQDTGTFGGLPSCSIIKPMLILYDYTGDRQFLDFAVECAEAFDDPTGRRPNLIANARTGRPLHTWYPHSEKWAKAYEMMSVLDGFCELYRHTNTEKYLQTAMTMHDLLKKYESNLLGSVGYNDIFAHAASQLNAISEPCDHVHWMRLNYELYMLTGNLEYVDDFELCYLNAFQAAVYRDGKWGSRGVRSQGRHFTAFEQAQFTHNHCCVNNLPRGYMNAAQLAVTWGQDMLRVNLYSPFGATLRTAAGTFQVAIGEGYATTGHVKVTVTSQAKQTALIAFRVPGWSGRTVITSGGVVSTPPAATFCLLAVPPQAATDYVLEFDMTPRLREFTAPVPRYPESDWHVQRWMNPYVTRSAASFDLFVQEPRCTLMAGPLLLARSRSCGNTDEEMFGTHTYYGRQAVCTLQPLPPAAGMAACFQATFTCGETRSTTTVCDYGTAGNAILEDDRNFSIFF